MNQPLPPVLADIALVLTRVLLGVVMFAHGWQKMFIHGIGRTTEGFESLSIPVAIVSASFVTCVELAGSILLVVGALTTVVCGLMMMIMVGAAWYVHLPHGIFVSQGGWELVGVIGAGLLALAAVGPGRFSVDHVVRKAQLARKRELELAGLC